MSQCFLASGEISLTDCRHPIMPCQGSFLSFLRIDKDFCSHNSIPQTKKNVTFSRNTNLKQNDTCKSIEFLYVKRFQQYTSISHRWNLITCIRIFSPDLVFNEIFMRGGIRVPLNFDTCGRAAGDAHYSAHSAHSAAPTTIMFLRFCVTSRFLRYAALHTVLVYHKLIYYITKLITKQLR